MGSENAKVRVGIYIEKAILEQADGLLEKRICSRST